MCIDHLFVYPRFLCGITVGLARGFAKAGPHPGGSFGYRNSLKRRRPVTCEAEGWRSTASGLSETRL
jgi:hypothetical protein